VTLGPPNRLELNKEVALSPAILVVTF